jgi:hypothetical protein
MELYCHLTWALSNRKGSRELVAMDTLCIEW